MYQARESETGAVLASRLRVADTHLSRLRGLLGTRDLPSGEGLWIKPCQQVHMFGMRYGLDVVFLDQDDRIVHLEAGLMPGKVSTKVPTARSVIEVPLGMISQTQLEVGDQLTIEGEADPARSAWIDNAAAVLCNIALAAVYSFFAAAHMKAIGQTGEWMMTLPFVAQEGLLVLLFLTRRRSFGTTGNVVDWVVGIAGTFLPLLLRPAGVASGTALLGAPLQVVGFLCAVVGLMSLGRSVGIVAANRGVQTDGFYRLVRHPMYASYMVTYIGYSLCYPTSRNLILVATTFVLLFLRVQAEERFLQRDPVYRAYLQRVPWRFLPYVY